MSHIRSIRALEILDSRAQPTVRVYVESSTGAVGTANVPSGASTGTHEALELRDGDKGRYGGKGVLQAISHVETELARALVGMHLDDQQALDQRMIELDGTDSKSRLGANAILGVSMAAVRAAALDAAQPLYRYLGQLIGKREPWLLPCPMFNIINGGAHADNTIDCQEFMVRPVGAESFREALRWSCEIYSTLKRLLKSRGLATSVGDEGGFAPQLADDAQACQLIVEAIETAGFELATQVTLALDVAASEFYEAGLYSDKKKLQRGLPGTRRSSLEQIELLASWAERFAIDSIEDGLSEQDWQSWPRLLERLKERSQIVGDDLLVTQPRFVQRAIEARAANAVLVKLNQVGTVSETLETIGLAQRAGWQTIISHRSGETEDSFIADLAVACGSSQIKTGAPCRSERVAKYNRLLEIEWELGQAAQFAGRGTKKR